MRKVVTILHMPNTMNCGSMMMGENLIHYLHQRYGDAIEFQIATPDPEKTRSRLERSLGRWVTSKTLVTVDSSILKRSNRSKLVKAAAFAVGMVDLQPWLLRSDVVVVLGGDDFTECYGYVGPIVELATYQVLRRLGIPVLMLGQSIGPFRSWREPIVRYLLRSVTLIGAREPLTYHYLTRRFKLRNVALGADLAFLPLAKEHEPPGLRLPDQYVCMVPSELLWRYALERDRELYLDALERIARTALGTMPEVDLVLLPHVFAPDNSDDRRAAGDLYRRLAADGGIADRTHLVGEELLPYQARAVLGGAVFTITGRMHAAISSLVRHRVAIALAYSEKYHGIIGEHLGIPELVVDVRYATWDNVVRDVARAIHLVANPLNSLEAKLPEKARCMQQRASALIDEVGRALGMGPSAVGEHRV